MNYVVHAAEQVLSSGNQDLIQKIWLNMAPSDQMSIWSSLRVNAPRHSSMPWDCFKRAVMELVENERDRREKAGCTDYGYYMEHNDLGLPINRYHMVPSGEILSATEFDRRRLLTNHMTSLGSDVIPKKRWIDPQRRYKTRSGKEVIGLKVELHNEVGNEVSFPVKGSVVVRKTPVKYEYKIWTLDGRSQIIDDMQWSPDDLVPA